MLKQNLGRLQSRPKKREKKVKFGLLKIKDKTQELKALVEEKKEKLREREEFLNRVKKVALPVEKGKAKKENN